jgi:hypothetical protein
MSTDAPQNADQSPARERPGIEIQQPTPSWNTWLSKFFWGRSGSQPQYPVSGSQDMIERSVSSCEPSCICEASKVACTLTFFLAQLCIPPDPRRPSVPLRSEIVQELTVDLNPPCIGLSKILRPPVKSSHQLSRVPTISVSTEVLSFVLSARRIMLPISVLMVPFPSYVLLGNVIYSHCRLKLSERVCLFQCPL